MIHVVMLGFFSAANTKSLFFYETGYIPKGITFSLIITVFTFGM